MMKIPVLTDEIQQVHAGKQAAVVDGEFVAFGKTLQEAYREAAKLGYDHDDILIAPIPRPGVLRA
jgi:hypothetical protein